DYIDEVVCRLNDVPKAPPSPLEANYIQSPHLRVQNRRINGEDRPYVLERHLAGGIDGGDGSNPNPLFLTYRSWRVPPDLADQMNPVEQDAWLRDRSSAWYAYLRPYMDEDGSIKDSFPTFDRVVVSGLPIDDTEKRRQYLLATEKHKPVSGDSDGW